MATIERQETSLIRVVSFDFAGFDVVDPAMDEQMTVRHARGYRRMGTQVLQLGDDVFLGEDRHAFFFVGAVTVIVHHGFRDFSVAQPALTVGIFSRLSGLSTARMAPQSEWPQMMMCCTPSASTAYSIAVDTPPFIWP